MASSSTKKRKSSSKNGKGTGRSASSSTKGSARGRKRRAPSAPMVRTSERSEFKKCRWSWDHAYNQGLKPRYEKPALRFGTLVHEALEVRYPKGIKRGPHPAKTFEKAYNAQLKDAEKEYGDFMKLFDDDDEAEWVDALDLGIDMMEHYVEHYGRDEEWEVIASEMTFKVPVYSPPMKHPKTKDAGFMNLRGDWIPKKVVIFYYVGTMDGVWRNRMSGKILVNDYKTTSNDAQKEALSKAILDEQATAYWTWGVDHLISEKILKPRQLENLSGMLYTMLRKSKRDEREQNADGHYLNKDKTVSKRQPPTYFHREMIYRGNSEREKARDRAIQEVIEMNMCRDGKLAIYKTPSTGSMGHCGWCGFRDICELHEQDADFEDLRDSTMTKWDGYSAHEIQEEGKGK